MKKLAVEPDFLLGRTLARGLVNKETGEIVANANEEITEVLLKKMADAGVEAFIQPGGSMRDEETFGVVNERGLVMALTGKRHFRH